MSVTGGGTGYLGLEWVEVPGGKRRQQRPGVPADVMEHFLDWRDTVLHVADRCRAEAARLVAAAPPEQVTEIMLPRRTQTAGRFKRSVLEAEAQPAVLLAEWGLTGPPPGVRALRPVPPEPSDRLHLLADAQIVLHRAGPNVPRPLRAVDDCDFVQMVHREGLTEQLRRRLVVMFRRAQLAVPFVPNRPGVDYADVWGKVAPRDTPRGPG